jgi:hypothetical protein
MATAARENRVARIPRKCNTASGGLTSQSVGILLNSMQQIGIYYTDVLQSSHR